MRNTSYLTLDVVIAIHEEMVEKYGGSHKIRDIGLIQSAVARPQSSFGGEDLYQSIFDKAAALFHSLMFNHAFIDANKRTAMVSTARFLFVGGYGLKVGQKEFVEFPLRVENKHLSIEQISKWLKLYSNKYQSI